MAKEFTATLIVQHPHPLAKPVVQEVFRAGGRDVSEENAMRCLMEMMTENLACSPVALTMIATRHAQVTITIDAADC